MSRPDDTRFDTRLDGIEQDWGGDPGDSQAASDIQWLLAALRAAETRADEASAALRKLDECYDLIAQKEAEVAELREALDEDPERWSFATLLLVAETMLTRHWPADIFNGSSGDPGPSFVVALREAVAECREVLARGGRNPA